MNSHEIADVLIRVTLGIFMIPHGILKVRGLMGHGDMTGEVMAFTKLGLQPARFWIVIVAAVQVLGGTMLTLGFLTRPAAVAAAIVLLGACILLKGRGWFWGRGGMEYSLFWALIALSVAIVGGGPHSIDAWLKL